MTFCPTCLQNDFNIQQWFAKHGQDKTRPLLDKVLAALKEEGVTKILATGYCYGGMLCLATQLPCESTYLQGETDWGCSLSARYVFDLAFDNLIDVAVVSHPTFISIEDLEVRTPALLMPFQTLEKNRDDDQNTHISNPLEILHNRKSPTPHKQLHQRHPIPTRETGQS